MRNLSILVLSFWVVGCAPDRPEPASGPKTFEAEGTVISVEGERVLINHGDIPGFMAAMTMTFPVSDPAMLDGLETGTRVRFRVIVDGASYTIDEIEVRE